MEQYMTDKTTNHKPATLPDGVRAAFGGSRAANIVHYYMSDEAYERGECLCNRTVMPQQEVEHWDTSHPMCDKLTCPECKARMQVYDYLKRTQGKK